MTYSDAKVVARFKAQGYTLGQIEQHFRDTQRPKQIAVLQKFFEDTVEDDGRGLDQDYREPPLKIDEFESLSEEEAEKARALASQTQQGHMGKAKLVEQRGLEMPEGQAAESRDADRDNATRAGFESNQEPEPKPKAKAKTKAKAKAKAE